MLYRFLILSDENEDFRRELSIHADASFLELNNFLIASLGYDAREMTTFHVCDEAWNKEHEVTLMDMSFNEGEQSFIMSDCRLSDLLTKKGDHLFFVFDLLSERGLFMELASINTESCELIPRMIFSQGEAPRQTSDVSTISEGYSAYDDEDFDPFDEDFSCEDYDSEELDEFGIYDEY